MRPWLTPTVFVGGKFDTLVKPAEVKFKGQPRLRPTSIQGGKVENSTAAEKPGSVVHHPLKKIKQKFENFKDKASMSQGWKEKQ